MCWMMAMLMRRASWNSVSSSQCGLILPSSVAIRLCSRASSVCMQVSTSCSFTRISPASKQNMLLFGRVQPSSGMSSFSGNRSFSPYSANTGFIRSNPL
uniref:Putative secreted protein n=1 Tax=Anopheles marajoara TaxID=58244 RepID=A0A2M4C8V9_9DIPT